MVMAENFVHHFFNRHEGFMQPTLVENQHHMDFKFPDGGISELRKKNNCVGGKKLLRCLRKAE